MFTKKVVKASIVAAAIALSCATQPAFAEPMSKTQRAAEHESWLAWIMSCHGQMLNQIWRSL